MRWICYQPNPSTGLPDSSLATTVSLDALGETITSTDPNWTEQTYVYDVLGQQVADEVTSISGDSGIDGSVREIGTTYTTLGQPQYTTTYSVAGGGAGTIVNQVEDVYNGLGQLTIEYQSVSGAVGDDTPYVEYNYTDLGDGNNSRLTSIVYPGGYTVDYNYNSGLDSDISRLSSISDFTGTLQSYQYLGLDTIVVMAEPEADLELTYLTTDDGTGSAGDEYTGLDQFGRVIEQNWYNTSTDTSMVDIQYGYDDDGNVLYQNNTLESTQSELFTYDGLGQLTSYEQGTLSDDNTVISSPSISETWGYDPLGNHLTDSTTTIGTVTITSTFNYDNQITSISSGTTPTYDADGNMTTDQTGLKYTYNAWGQEVDVYSGETLEENYTYDGLGDRMTNTVGSTTTNFYNSSLGQVLEEQTAGTGHYTTRYVWSENYINQMVSRDTDTSGTGLTASGDGYNRLWPVADADYDVVALVNTSGSVVEQYSYDPFGAVTYLSPTYTVESSSSYGWVYGFQGMRLDPVTGNLLAKSRQENTNLGTWTSEDPTGFAGGNLVLYGFENNGPAGSLDPSGLAPHPPQGMGYQNLGNGYWAYDGWPQGVVADLLGSNGKPGLTLQRQGTSGTAGQGIMFFASQTVYPELLIGAWGGLGGQGGWGGNCGVGGGGGAGAGGSIQISGKAAIVATGGDGGGGGGGTVSGGDGGAGGSVYVWQLGSAWFAATGVLYETWVQVFQVNGGAGGAANGQDGGHGGYGANLVFSLQAKVTIIFPGGPPGPPGTQPGVQGGNGANVPIDWLTQSWFTGGTGHVPAGGQSAIIPVPTPPTPPKKPPKR